MQGVYVPKMFTDLTTQRVLVMEWIEGRRLKSSSQSGPQGAQEELKMVEIGVRCSLEQMFEEGYYHSDPHPGNLFKMDVANSADGKLAYIDFGMMGEIEGSIRRYIFSHSCCHRELLFPICRYLKAVSAVIETQRGTQRGVM